MGGADGRGSDSVSRKIIFIADYFLGDFFGGAEMANEELIGLLQEKGYEVEKKRCSEVTVSYIRDNISCGFILGNFMMLGGQCKKEIYNCNYVLYEHDHKYVVNRNPAAYPGYKAPKEYILDRDLYGNAAAIFCQSKIHAEVLKINLGDVNAISLGSSLWTEQFLREASNIKVEKTKKAAIMKSDNHIKNQFLAEEYCQKNNIPYDVIEAPSSLELLKKLSQYEYFVFFPKVLETLSRVSVEAKMVGCKLITNKLLGVASEEWFKGTPKDILEEMSSAREKTVNLFLEELKSKKKDNVISPGITVILNAYRRPYNLKMQIESIKNQTIKPDQIWLWVNDHEDNRNFDFSSLGVDRVFQNNYNWKFYGRFAGALLADTEFVAIFDDDTIPGSKWFENCLNNNKLNPGIQGSAGIILKSPEYYMSHDRCGWPTQNPESTRVDLVGHAWFFKRDWLQYLWREKPYTWDNGEDIQFSYLAQKYGGINTFCPPHPPQDKDLHGSILGNELGIDNKATSTNQAVSHQQFFHERDKCVQNAINNGWQTVLELNK
jgi:hypothetical protein